MNRPNMFAIIAALVVMTVMAYVTNFELYHSASRENGGIKIETLAYDTEAGFEDHNSIEGGCTAVPNIYNHGWPFTAYTDGSGCGYSGNGTTFYPVGIGLNAGVGAALGTITFVTVTMIRRRIR